MGSSQVDDYFVIDTKWRNIRNSSPSTQDLRQMYVYNDYRKSVRAMLLYPAEKSVPPNFVDFHQRDHKCAIGRLNIIENGRLKKNLGKEILNWYQYTQLS